MLFEKCEVATKSIDLTSTYNFNEDAQMFLDQKMKDKQEIISKDSEVNELVSSSPFFRFYKNILRIS